MNRIEFITFLKVFKEDLLQNKTNWENKTLEEFLDGMISYSEDLQGYYDNQNSNIDANHASWDNFATILKGASMYE